MQPIIRPIEQANPGLQLFSLIDPLIVPRLWREGIGSIFAEAVSIAQLGLIPFSALPCRLSVETSQNLCPISLGNISSESM